jgi:hypothetical protein
VTIHRYHAAAAAIAAAVALPSCDGKADDARSLPQLAPAVPAALFGSCDDLAARLAAPNNTTITAVTYQAVAKLTPMAHELIQMAYGKGPDRNYFGGCSNGGRHAMIAAARYADQYDGILAAAPGFRLPLAALSNIAGAQRYATVATDPADLASAFTTDERRLLADAVLEQCDALDGIADGIVHDTVDCQAHFDIATHVSVCDAERDGTCLTGAQKSVLAEIFAGPRTQSGALIYSSLAIASMKKKVPQSMGECFQLIEHDMLAGPWVMGTDFTICDMYLFTIAQWLESDGVDVSRS